MENIGNANISLREELAIAYECECFEREVNGKARKARRDANRTRKIAAAYEGAKRLYEAVGRMGDFDRIARGNLPLAIAYAELIEAYDREAEREAEDYLCELSDQIRGTCEYLRSHSDDRASLCGLVALLDTYSDVSKDAYGVRVSAYWKVPSDVKALVETLTDEETDRFWEVMRRDGRVAPYGI